MIGRGRMLPGLGGMPGTASYRQPPHDDRALRCAGAERGRPLPLGAQLLPGGAKLSVFTRHADAAELVLFDTATRPQAARRFALDRSCHRTRDIRHLFVRGVQAGVA